MQNEQTEQRMVPSPLKQLDDPPTLTFAALKHASNPAARHSHAEKDIAAFVTAIVPAHIPYDPEKVQFTYEHGMKGWVIQCLLSLATFLENLGRGGPTTEISVDPHEDKMGRHHVRCDYVIHFIPFTGQTSKQIRSSTDLATWYTASIPSTYLGSLEDISAAISSQFQLAALQVTNVKRQYAALGVRTGKIHVDYELAHPDSGIPWHLLHLTRYVTLPLQQGEALPQKIKMEINPVLFRDGNLCSVGYCHGGKCLHNTPNAGPPTTNKRKEKEQERLLLTNKYAKGGSSADYLHPHPRLK